MSLQIHTPRPQRGSWFQALDPALLLSAAAIGGFYAFLHQPSMQGSILHRYASAHPVDYVIVSLWIWGAIDILFRISGFPRDLLALRADWLPPRTMREPVSRAQEILDGVRARPRWMRESRVGQRLIAALENITVKGTAEDSEEHLKYLSEQDDDRTHANYTLARFIIGTTPVLGFLGTVVHFGGALSGLSFEEIDKHLAHVVGEMGQAFNTTTAALAAAMFMMCALFLCERIERGIISSVDRLLDRELKNRFEVADANVVPVLASLRTANDEALKMMSATLQRQVDQWSEALQSVLQKFEEKRIQDAQGWVAALGELESRHERLDAVREQRLGEILSLADARQEKLLSGVQSTLNDALSMRDVFASLVETVDGIGRGEGKLVELQHSLTQNLRVIHETQQIDDALHGLTAAIHLLTARHSGGGASKNAA